MKYINNSKETLLTIQHLSILLLVKDNTNFHLENHLLLTHTPMVWVSTSYHMP